MTPLLIVDMGKEALLLVLYMSGPMLAAGLFVGLIIGVFQAVTQIHEMTLTFIPKIIAVGATLAFFLPWIITKFVDYTIKLYETIPTLLK